MKEVLEIPVLEGEIRAGDDVSIPITDVSITLTGYTFEGVVKSSDDDVSISNPNLSFTIVGTNGVTIALTAAQTALMTDKEYYSWCRWTDTNGKKCTFLKIVYKMVD
jgi:hypothetical protein